MEKPSAPAQTPEILNLYEIPPQVIPPHTQTGSAPDKICFNGNPTCKSWYIRELLETWEKQENMASFAKTHVCGQCFKPISTRECWRERGLCDDCYCRKEALRCGKRCDVVGGTCDDQSLMKTLKQWVEAPCACVDDLRYNPGQNLRDLIATHICSRCWCPHNDTVSWDEASSEYRWPTETCGGCQREWGCFNCQKDQDIMDSPFVVKYHKGCFGK